MAGLTILGTTSYMVGSCIFLETRNLPEAGIALMRDPKVTRFFLQTSKVGPFNDHFPAFQLWMMWMRSSLERSTNDSIGEAKSPLSEYLSTTNNHQEAFSDLQQTNRDFQTFRALKLSESYPIPTSTTHLFRSKQTLGGPLLSW